MDHNEASRTVLIVDDSSTSRMITRRCLEMASTDPMTFLEAPDGAEALSVLQNESVDLIITDINMPKMDGMTFVWKVKMNERLEDTPILVLSSMKNERMENALLGLGVTSFIQKPISPAKVAEYVGAPV
jgi:two-component system, chemotaxis family, chemotaxis protein CheY